MIFYVQLQGDYEVGNISVAKMHLRRTSLSLTSTQLTSSRHLQRVWGESHNSQAKPMQDRLDRHSHLSDPVSCLCTCGWKIGLYPHKWMEIRWVESSVHQWSFVVILGHFLIFHWDGIVYIMTKIQLLCKILLVQAFKHRAICQHWLTFLWF